MAASIPCGPDLDKTIEGAGEFAKAGCTTVSLVQVGDEGQDHSSTKPPVRCSSCSVPPPDAVGLLPH